MLWVIDAGNTQTVFGCRRGEEWVTFRFDSDRQRTPDEWAAQLSVLCELKGVPFAARAVVIGSVVPTINDSLHRFCMENWHVAPTYLEGGEAVGLPVKCIPPSAAGADRLANALGALLRYEPPVVVVDFGTATTFDVVDAEGAYVGGAIMPGVQISADALAERTAKLPRIELKRTANAIGRTTVESLQSGIVRGYGAAIDGLARQIKAELGGKAVVLATGGLGQAFADEVCEEIDRFEPHLTLDGLVEAARRFGLEVGG